MNNSIIHPFNAGAHIVVYFRDSGGDDQTESVVQQEHAIRDWANNNGLIISCSFRDVARPGSSTVGRDGFQAMIEHFRHEANEEGLVVWDYQRFSRSQDDSQFYRADIRRRGYKFFSLNDSVPEGPTGRLFEAVLDWKAERYLADLSTDVRRGLASLVRQYGAVPGKAPKGFMREPVQLPNHRDGKVHIAHRWVPDPDVAPRVRRAFEMRSAGHTLSEIRAETGLYQSVNCYQTFFANPLYRGELHYGDLVIPDYCEPIVDPTLWEQVQVRSRQLTRAYQFHPRRIASAYLLSGLVHCARCGSALSGMMGGKNYQRYKCSRASHRGDCDLQVIPRKVLDNAVLTEVATRILDPGVLASIQQQEIAFLEEQAARQKHDRDSLALELAAVRRRIANVTAAIAEAGTSRALTATMVELERQEQELVQRQATAAGLIPIPLSPEQIAALAGRLTTGSDADRRVILRGMIETITVDRDGATILGQIRWYIPPGTVPLSAIPSGIMVHTHSFTAQMQSWTRRSV